MDERCVVGGALLEQGMGLNRAVGASTMMNEFIPPEKMAELKAENEKREKEYRKQRVLQCVLEVAERLVMRGKTPEQALGIATDFVTRASETVKTFSLPE